MEEPRDGDSESDVEPEPGPGQGPSTSHHHLSSSSRQMRNEAEKKRRDTLNGYITELGRLVPTVDSTPRRIDKISILRLAATYLMQNQILHKGRVQEKPFLPVPLHSYNLSLSMVEEMDAFLLVVTSSGKIVFVSHTVEKLLGHAQIDMFGQSLYNFTLKEDHPVLTFNLQPDGEADGSPEGEGDAGSGDDTSCSSESSPSPPPAPDPALAPGDAPETQRRSFFLQLSQRCVSRSEQPEYKRVHLLGNLRVPDAAARGRRSRRHTGDWLGGEGSVSNESVLVAIVKLDSHIRELSIMEANKDEYVTRHLIDGRIIYSDHRISLVAGYLTEEVNGMSAFKFMHQEDVMFTIVALRQMYDRGEGFGCSCYRLQSKTGQFIYLRTHGFLEKNESNEVESFICINTLMREEDGKRLIQEMKTRYTANLDSTRTVNALVEKEVQLEEVISQLIPATVDSHITQTPFPDPQYMKAMFTGKSLPPASVHSIQLGLGSPKQEQGQGQGRAEPDRPSVITSGCRRRRHDSDGPAQPGAGAGAKRRRSPPPREREEPPRLSPEELSRAILARDPPERGSRRGHPYGPRPRRGARTAPDPASSPDRSPCETASGPDCPRDDGGFPGPDRTPCDDPADDLLSPNQAIHANREDFLNHGQTIRANQTVHTNRDSSQTLYSKRHLRSNSSQGVFAGREKAVPAIGKEPPSPGRGLCPARDSVHCPESVPYSSKIVSNPNPASFQSQVTLTPKTVGDALYSVDVTSSSKHRQYLIESMLNQSEYILPEMEPEQVPTSSDNHVSDSPLYLIVEQSHSQLESNLQIQQMQITSIKQDIKQVPKPHSDQVFKNFTKLEDEHKQNQHLLHILKQDISRTCP